LLLGVLALFMFPMSVRESSTHLNRRDFVLDDLVLLQFHEEGGEGANTFVEGRLSSTEERYVTDRLSIVGLDLLRQLEREKRTKGFKAPVRYLPKQGQFWPAVDRINQFRVLSREEFDHGFPAWMVAANIVFAILSVFLIRRGAGFPRRQLDSPQGPSHSPRGMEEQHSSGSGTTKRQKRSRNARNRQVTQK